MPNPSKTPNVAFVREEVKKLQPSYDLIKDCIDGEPAIKCRKTKYLPVPNSLDVSPENVARYEAYRGRAVFYNVTQRTLAGLVGQVFMRAPVVEVPKLLEAILLDADGGGVSAEQLTKRATMFTVAFGRTGFLSDYPVLDVPATREQIDSGEVKPTINVYAPWDIINWRKIVIGSKEYYSLIVLQETYVESDDGFEMKKGKQWRVLRLINGVYEVTIWRQSANRLFEIIGAPAYPKDSKGNSFTQIPFEFVGCENNDDVPDNPPLYDLASINVAHYRNSADYEESCYMVGQPTPYFAGLTEDWVKTVMGGSVGLGSRGAVPLPVGGTAGLLQVAPNTMPFEAMEHKERQMVALGAKLVEQSKVQRTATEAGIENTSEMSVLSSVAKNVSAAFKEALKWCADFVDASEVEIKFELNTDFDLAKMSPQDRQQLVSEWQAGAIAFEEMRANLRRAGVATLDDTEAKEKIAQEMASAVDLSMDEAERAAQIQADAAAAAKPAVPTA